MLKCQGSSANTKLTATKGTRFSTMSLLKGRLSYNNLTSSDLKLAASSTDHKKGLVLNTERGEKEIQGKKGIERRYAK